MNDTDKAWRWWGENDPYFAVLTQKKFRKETIVDFKTEFMQSGEDQIAALVSEIEERFGHFEHGTALEFGCGVGRLVLPLAHRFEKVVAVDVSEAMLAEAKRNCQAAGLANVSFLISDAFEADGDHSFDLVYSSLVLQHIRETRGLALIDRLLGSLKAGGVAALHISLRRRFRWGKRAAYFLRNSIPAAGRLLNFLQGERLARPAIRMSEYSLPSVLALYGKHGMTAPAVKLLQHGDVLGALITGRRASS